MSEQPARRKTASNSRQPDEDGLVADNGLTAKQDRAVAALLHEPTIGRAAAVAGVGERTLQRWMTEPVFRRAVLAARREAFGHAIGLTQKYAPVAVATLVKVMQDAAVTPGAKVTAAAVLLRFGREGIELDDLAERVEALERMASSPSPPRPVVAGLLEDER
jgi:hypothetical protein